MLYIMSSPQIWVSVLPIAQINVSFSHEFPNGKNYLEILSHLSLNAFLFQFLFLCLFAFRGRVWDLVDQWRHGSLWQRHRNRSAHVTMEIGGADSGWSNAEAGNDQSTLHPGTSRGMQRTLIVIRCTHHIKARHYYYYTSKYIKSALFGH